MRIITSLLLSLFFLPLGAQDFSLDTVYERAKIIAIDKEPVIEAETGEQYFKTTFSLKLLGGKLKGTVKKINFQGEDTMPEYAKYKKGDVIYIGFNEVELRNEVDAYISMYDVDNTPGLILIGILFVAIIVGVGHLRGALSLLSLGLTIVMIFFIFIPLTLKGVSPLFSTVAISTASVLVTIPIITGRTKKSLAAIGGATSGVVIATFIAIICGATMHLAGIITDDMMKVFYMAEHEIDLKDLALSGMIIAALGAIMDVAVSIASATAELYQANPDLPAKTAFKSAMNVGRDILGSMVNTLILAYIGSSLSLVLIISMKFNAQMPMAMIFSHNHVLIELIKSFVGTAGMFLSIPATAFLAVKLHAPKEQRRF